MIAIFLYFYLGIICEYIYKEISFCDDLCILGDVLLHCVVDAILGALGLPDIGQIFPDNDPKWKGAASSVFIKEAVSLIHSGAIIFTLACTLISKLKFSVMLSANHVLTLFEHRVDVFNWKQNICAFSLAHKL